MFQNLGLNTNANRIFLIVLNLLLISSLYYTYSLKHFTKTDIYFQNSLAYAKIFLCLFLVTMAIYIVFVAKMILNQNRQLKVFAAVFTAAMASTFAFLMCFYISSELGQVNPLNETEIELDVSKLIFSINMILILQVISFAFILYQLVCEYYNPTTQENPQQMKESLSDLENFQKEVESVNESIEQRNQQILTRTAQQIENAYDEKIKQISQSQISKKSAKQQKRKLKKN